MLRSRIAAPLAAAALLLACAGSKAPEDRSARRIAAAPMPTPAPSSALQTLSSGPVTCEGGEIYVANSAGNSIAVHDRTAAGNTAPLRVISGDATGLTGGYAPYGVAVDPVHGELFATASGRILVFSRSASGNSAPLRSITGASTGLYTPGKLALDLVHDELWVVEGHRLAAFPRGASGDVAPLRTLDRSVMWPWAFSGGLAVDPVHDEVIATATTTVKVFARTSSGPAAPIREIGGASTRLTHPVAVALDPARDELVVIDEVSYATSSAILSFPRLAEGDVAPARTITNSSTTMLNPRGLAVDTARDEVLVANSAGYPNYPSYSGNSVTVFPRSSSETWPSPVRLLRGDATALAWPWDIDLAATTAYCAAGHACAMGGCMPAGSDDCGNGHYCPAGAMCGSLFDDPSYCGGGAFCAGSPAGPLVSCLSPDLCPHGASCPSGALCASGGCMPADALDCGGGVHCPKNHVCNAMRTGCVPAGGTDCLNGRYCGENLLCASGGLWCVPPGVVLCGDGWWCPSGTVCTPAADGFTCDPPSSGGGGGGAFCYSTSVCVLGAGGTCNCSGAVSQGQCLSGHPPCVAVGGACGSGTACCVGETCVNGQCEAGCGRCAGKGCTP